MQIENNVFTNGSYDVFEGNLPFPKILENSGRTAKMASMEPAQFLEAGLERELHAIFYRASIECLKDFVEKRSSTKDTMNKLLRLTSIVEQSA